MLILLSLDDMSLRPLYPNESDFVSSFGLRRGGGFSDGGGSGGSNATVDSGKFRWGSRPGSVIFVVARRPTTSPRVKEKTVQAALTQLSDSERVIRAGSPCCQPRCLPRCPPRCLYAHLCMDVCTYFHFRTSIAVSRRSGSNPSSTAVLTRSSSSSTC